MSNNQDQIARRKATQDVIAANRDLFEERMHHYYEEMGLGTWTPRLSAEERAAAKERAKQDKAVAKIREMAKEAGIGVLLVEDPEIEAKIQAVHDGTAEPGVTIDWKGESDEALAAEEARILAETSAIAETEAYEEEQRRQDEAADAALNVAVATQPV